MQSELSQAARDYFRAKGAEGGRKSKRILSREEALRMVEAKRNKNKKQQEEMK